MDSTTAKLAKMESNIDHLTKAFDEFKADTKEFHKMQTNKLEEMAKTWQEIGGLMKGMADLQYLVNLNTEFRTKNDELIESIRRERLDRKKRITDTIWKYGQWMIITVLAIYVYISNQIQSVTVSESQAQAFFSAIEDLKN